MPASRNTSPRWPHRPRAALALAVSAVIAVTGCSSAAPDTSPTGAAPNAPASSAANFPNTAAGKQARWLYVAANHGKVPESQIRAHFDSTFLAQFPAADVAATLRGLIGLRLNSITSSTADSTVFVVTVATSTKTIEVNVDAQGLISGLHVQARGASAPTSSAASWADIDSRVDAVAPKGRLLVASVRGSACQSVHAVDAGTAGPLGSAFKLYVLDALARAIASGKVSWSQPLTVTSAVKSLPSGTLQDEPDGTRLSVQQVATAMISRSDNTAANMLIKLLGRGAVESAMRAAGIADPGRNVPFLNPNELFVLKLSDWPTLAGRYLALDPAGRGALLAGTVDKVPVSSLNTGGWVAPRAIDALEWFASPTDICRVYAELAGLANEPKLAPLGGILQVNTGGIGLDSSQWQRVWFKGGDEPGVLTVSFLARDVRGRSFLVSILAENPSAALPASAVQVLVSAAKSAFELADH